jgi:FkbM family methyltransferase
MRIEISQEEFLDIINERFEDTEIKNIMEIGALDGKDSAKFKERYPHANVYTIEGLPDNYEEFLTGRTDIIPINIVMTDYDGVVDYHKKEVNGIHGIFNRGDKYGTDKLESVPCKTFESVCSEYGIDGVDFVKIDVEGATYEVINGMGGEIEKIKIMHIETESYPFFEGQKLHDEVCELLESKGFKMLLLSEVIIDLGGKQHDSVWINEKYL